MKLPIYQRIYVNDDRAEDTSASIIENAVAEATEQLHDDMAYGSSEMRWKLWSSPSATTTSTTGSTIAPDAESQKEFVLASTLSGSCNPLPVRILGLGPNFDDASYEQNGHIRVDFGLDTPWLAETLEDEDLDEEAAKHIQQNVEMLLAFTLSVEKNCGVSSRLLWTESGEPLVQKLIDRLQRLN